MSEQTLTEALEDIDVDIDLDISDEDIERAALPANKRVEEEVQDESTYIDLSEEEVEDISPVTEDEIEEDFEINEEVLMIELIKLSDRLKSTIVENCKQSSMQDRCRKKIKNSLPSLEKIILIPLLRIYRFKKGIQRNFKAG